MTIVDMKIRNGFISNSSSSSFLIGERGDNLLRLAKKTLFETASEAVVPVSVNQVAINFLEASGRKKTLKEFLKCSKGVEYDYVTFRSINHPTEIFYMNILGEKYDRNIFISTCNNEGQYWGNGLDKISKDNNVPVEYLGEDGFYEELEMKFYNSTNKLFESVYSGDGLYTRLNYQEIKLRGFKVCVFSDYESGFADEE